MKSYNHLWEKVVSSGNIKLAIKNASKGKRDRERVNQIFNNQDAFVPHFQCMAETYKRKRKRPKIIYDGIVKKQREIIVPSFDEQVLHHMIVNVLSPIIQKGMYAHAHGSVPKRGPAKGKKTIKKWIAHDPKGCKYYLKMDIRHFFGSIGHERLEAFMARRVHDSRFLRLMHEVIGCTDEGLPLGFHTSHWLAMWYLQGLDHFIKQGLGAAHYIRYMDDMVIFGSNKRRLHRMREAIGEYLRSELGLELKGNWQVRRFHYVRKGKDKAQFLDFMGYRFYRNRVTMRRGIMLRMTRKAASIGRKEKPTIYDCRQIISALGWIKSTDTYNMYKRWIKPNVDFKKCKRRIGNFDRREAKRKEQPWLGGNQLIQAA